MNSIYIMGDSHARNLFLDENISGNKREGHGTTYLNSDGEVYWISGATIKGLSKEESITNFKRKLLEYIKDKKGTLVLKLGQVDIEVIYHYKLANKELISIDRYIRELIDIYRDFLMLIKDKINVVVFGINLPCIKKRNTINHIKFNDALERMCDDLKIRYFDICDETYDDNRKYIRREYIIHDNNVHIKISDGLRALIEDKIMENIDG